jgi:NAD(P)-dependent dehydrogenase (short-subunit alcohol dehydrogenase family)
MESFEGRLAVITGGGTGMGRELARQLAADGCHVAMCDVSDDNMDETRALCLDQAPAGTHVSTHVTDVSHEAEVSAFASEVAQTHDTDQLNLLFNNAGIGGGGSFVVDGRDEWDKTFAVCWGGVYHCTRAFLPMLLASDAGHVVNTSSVNGFWASLGPTMPHTAYSAAKFAVKGFTEALVTDFRLNAPHLRASVVMPGHIGTSIVINSGRILGRDPKDLTAEQVGELRQQLLRRGIDAAGASDEDLRQGMQMMAEGFRDLAPTSAAEAATIILDGVRNASWRILVGDDAAKLDEAVRREPEQAYEAAFWERMRGAGVFSTFL